MNRLLLLILLASACGFAQSEAPHNDLLLHQGGFVRFDTDSDGCDTQDVGAPIKLNLQNSDQTRVIYPDASGIYGCQTGTYTVTPEFQNTDYFTVSPASAVISIGSSGNGHSMDFCVTPNGSHRDASVIIIPGSEPVAGNLASYKIMVTNNGNQTVSGVVQFAYPSIATDLVAAVPVAHVRTPAVLNWTYDNLRAFESRIYQVTLQVHSPTDNNPVNIGDELRFSAGIIPSEADETPQDNTYQLVQFAVNSFDPNNKIVLEGAVVPPSMIGQYLNYVINFENTGNSPAQKVVINDEIDISQFEISSLQITGLSHPGIPLVLGNKVEIYFQNIALAPQQQGFVSFKIKTKGSLSAGSTVSNKAKIYFDLNFPIDTNTANTTFELLGVAQQLVPEAKIYPNPTSGVATIQANQQILSITLTDAQGRQIAVIPAVDNIATHDLSAYSAGIYYVRITTSGGTLIRKLVRQ